MGKNNPILKAEKRSLSGRKVKQLRQEGWLPASVYGKGFEPVSIQLATKDFEKVFEQVGESGLVDLDLEAKTYPIIFRNPQYHPLWGDLIHVDCYKVNLKEKITTVVPLEFVGESLAVKNGNVLVEVIGEIEIEALPADLPEKIEVDISKLETLENIITAADLAIDREKITIKGELDQVIAKVEEPQEEIVEEVAPANPEEVEATAQKTVEETSNEEAKKETKEEEKKD